MGNRRHETHGGQRHTVGYETIREATSLVIDGGHKTRELLLRPDLQSITHALSSTSSGAWSAGG